VMSRIYYAHLLIILQRPDEALIQGELAVELDPLNPLILGLYSVVLRSTGQFQKALEYAEKALSIHPGHDFSIGQLKQTLLSMEEYDKAFEYRKIVLAKFFSEELIRTFDQIYREQGYFEAEKEIVRQFELLSHEKYVSPIVLASRHYSNKEYSKTLDDLEKGYEMHEPNLPYLAAGQNGFVDLYDSTRFIAVVKKMNLPLPRND
jgi:tetratricopeptide (TPR) repeat protein